MFAGEEFVTHQVAHSPVVGRRRRRVQLHAELRDGSVARRASPVVLARCEKAFL